MMVNGEREYLAANFRCGNFFYCCLLLGIVDQSLRASCVVIVLVTSNLSVV